MRYHHTLELPLSVSIVCICLMFQIFVPVYVCVRFKPDEGETEKLEDTGKILPLNRGQSLNLSYITPVQRETERETETHTGIFLFVSPKY